MIRAEGTKRAGWRQRMQDLSARCARCGKCQSVCPVYDVFHREQAVARGKVALMKQGALGRLPAGLSPHRWIYMCLKCLRCQSTCPSGVDFAALQRLARSRYALRSPVPVVARVGARLMLGRRWLFDLTLRAFYLAQKAAGLSRLPPQRHVILLNSLNKAVPKIARRTTLAKYASRERGDDRTVAFFTGCLMNYVYTDAADCAIELIRKAGWKVIVPRGQVCCGAPLASLGDENGFRMLARRNLEALRRVGARYIVSGCASCASTLRMEYGTVLGDEAAEMGESVLEFSQLLDRSGFKPAKKLQESVTYHDPCHLGWVLAEKGAPRRLIAQAAAMAEMDGADLCCGMGGVFSSFNPAVSDLIAEKKVGAARRTGAATLVTTCPGCMMQIEGQFLKHHADIKVEHLAQLLARSER